MSSCTPAYCCQQLGWAAAGNESDALGFEVFRVRSFSYGPSATHMLVLIVICRFGSAVMAAFRIKPTSLAAKASRYLLQKFPDVSCKSI